MTKDKAIAAEDSLLNPSMLENADERRTESQLVNRNNNACENEVIHGGDVIRSCRTEKSSCLEQCEAPSNSLAQKSGRSGRNKRASKLIRKKYGLRSSLGSSERVLRSKVQEKPKSIEASNSNTPVDACNGVVKKKRGRKKMGAKRARAVPDEYSRIRKRLRYFLHRIQYEQNLIDAYSSEGWKGSSLEKLKPEKELQRATSEILRRKLKIRDLFQHIDSLCAEGRFPESLFDSDGQIDCEDIFCAKCGSKDLPANNDIILCDGACDRGFHQLCLEPPLLSEDIPPGDEGWLCPGCDCKVDCFDLLNDSYGTDFVVSDNWEKVFQEEASAARDGKDQEHNLDGPSDDSDDEDYDPDGPGTVEKAEEDDYESSSDESDGSSDPDELEGRTKDDQKLGLSSDDSEDEDFDPDAPDDEENEKPKETVNQLSSDDSEDDEFDPDAPDADENVKQESSSSDFTSDSEDLEHEVPSSGNKKLKREQSKPSSLKDELIGILDPDPSQDGSSSRIMAKRHVERLDYKKLHDETYGNLPSDSSDDEDFGSTAQRKRKKTTGDAPSVPPNENGSGIESKKITEAINDDGQRDNERTPRERTRKSLRDFSPSSGSAAGNSNSSSNRRLGEAATKGLLKSFMENQYPDKAKKESLAKEFGLQVKQVTKWFDNTRWSWNHPSGKAGRVENASKKSEIMPQVSEKLDETNLQNPTCNGTKTSNPLPEKQELVEESSDQKSTAPSLRRKRGRPSIETPKTLAAVVTPETTGIRTRGRHRKSAS